MKWWDVFWPKREPARMRSWAEMAKSRYALSSVCSASPHTLAARLEFTNPGERLGEPAELPVAFSATETQASTSMSLLHTRWSRQVSIIASVITRAAQRTRRHRRGARVRPCARMNTRLGDQDQDHWCEPDVRNVHINPEIIRISRFPPLAHDSLHLNSRSRTVQMNIITRAITGLTQSYPIRVFYAVWHARAACGRALFPNQLIPHAELHKKKNHTFLTNPGRYWNPTRRRQEVLFHPDEEWFLNQPSAHAGERGEVEQDASLATIIASILLTLHRARSLKPLTHSSSQSEQHALRLNWSICV